MAAEVEPGERTPDPCAGDADVVARLRDVGRSLVSGRRVILAGFPVAASPPTVDLLSSLGAEACFVVGPMVGTGPLPDPAQAEWFSLDIEAADTMAVFRRFEAAMAQPPAELADRLDRFDPSRDALVLVAPYDATTAVAGRPAFGARRPAWVAVEDKTTNDALFDRAGVARPPSAVVPLGDTEALRAAHARLDAGAGTVWSGDARDGFNGGGTRVRWVTDVATAAEARAFLAAHCDRVRVAPFLDGVPCSIHGLVTGDGIAVLRPVEMVTVRSAEPPALRYAGAATFFDPPDAVRRAMRDAARRVGELLRDEVGFAGSYGIDGVLTADGFLPTELNPRFGAGLGAVARALPELPLLPLHWLAAAGRRLPVAAADIERALVAAADARRAGGGWLTVGTRITETAEHPLALRHGRAVPAGDGPSDGTLEVGPSAEGGFVRFLADPDRTPVGPSVALRVCAALAWADEALGLGLGPLHPAAPAHG
ncbi:MAG TPA: ATP-grasp domain-containing protein [Acidimicrobiales bacterium]